MKRLLTIVLLLFAFLPAFSQGGGDRALVRRWVYILLSKKIILQRKFFMSVIAIDLSFLLYSQRLKKILLFLISLI